MLTAEQIIKNYNEFLKLLENWGTASTNPKRWEKLLKFYNHYDERISMMPASSKTDYHNAFDGGYIDHILKVYKISLDVDALWKKHKEVDYTNEELAFSVLNHDLGKFGDFDNEFYIPNDSKWHVEKGMIYKLNPVVDFMTVPDRTLYILQSLQLKLTINEFLAIKLHDGLYDDANKPYLMSFNPDMKNKKDLPYVLHQADFMSSKIEKS